LTTASTAAQEWLQHQTKLVVAAYGTQIQWFWEDERVITAQAALEDAIQAFFFDGTIGADQLKERWRDFYRSMMKKGL
jgi:hypothetical protein